MTTSVKGDAVHLKQLVPSIDKETLEYANKCFTTEEALQAAVFLHR